MIAVLAAAIALGVFVADVSAMYDPTMGYFLQRDPGPGAMPIRIGSGAGPTLVGRFIPRDPEQEAATAPATREVDEDEQTGPASHVAQYIDGMDLYCYARSSPLVHVDPQGLSVPCGQLTMSWKKGPTQWPVYGNSARAKVIAGGGKGCVTLLSPKGIYCTYSCDEIKSKLTYPPGPRVPLLNHEACHACAFEDCGLSQYLKTWIPGDLTGYCSDNPVSSTPGW